ncbi:hypothetical protein GGI20_002020 [Coemansia sp. BCRC 34301]|nr:hypothetical protein GGI20_002020 [Coemansia sp. BCRC 34301]
MSGDDSDEAEFTSFASAPGPSSFTAVSVHVASPEQHADERHRRRSRKKRHRSDRIDRADRAEHRQKTISQGPSPAEDLWGQLLEDGILSVDRRGDANLLLFKETPKSTAPKFVRRAGRRVLGLGGGFRVDRDTEGPIIKLVQGSDTPKRYMDIDWKSQRHTTEHVDVSDSHLVATDFMPLVESEKRGGNSTSSRAYDSDAEGGPSSHPDFRSIEGRAKDSSSAASAHNRVATGDEPIARSEAQTKMIELERKVSKNPHDISAWQALALLQEELVSSSFAPTAGRSKLSQRSKRAVAESQIEVYRRALRHNPESRLLVFGYFERYSSIFDDAALADEWELMLNSTSDPEIVKRYVAVLQTMSAQFTVAKVTAVYVKGIRRLQRVLGDKIGPERDSVVVQGLLTAVVELIHCACLFMRESGFAELAISVYQAVVEWYLLTPEKLYLLPFSHRKRAFERFWDSGAARIGMADACGWSCYDNTNTESTTANLCQSVSSEPPDLDSDQLSAWCRAEQKLAEQHGLPIAFSMAQLDEATIGSGCVDPNSLVVFEDVEPFIVDLPWSEDTASMLLDRFMQFLGVVGPRTFVLTKRPPASCDQSSGSLPTLDDCMWTLPGLAGSCESMYVAVRELSLWSQAGAELRFPFVSTPLTLDTCDTPLPYAYSCPWLWQRSQNFQDLARHSFELLLTTAGLRLSSTRLRLLLATAEMEWSFALSSGKSVGKRLLKTYPTCLALWNTYAKLHARYGQWDEARAIWSSILVRAEDLAESSQKWVVVVRKSWAVLEILHGSEVSVAVRILAAAAKGCEPQLLLQRIFEEPGSTVSSVDIPCARKLAGTDYADFDTEACEAEDGEVVLARLVLQMWLAYISEASCAAASKVYSEWTDKQKPNLADYKHDVVELATLELCSIHLYHSTTSKVHRARDLRSHLEHAVQQYPHSTVFWEMFIHSESQSRVANRVGQRVSAALAREPQSADLQFLDLYATLSCAPMGATGVYDRVRGALKRATRRDHECWSPLIWLSCIAIEHMYGGSAARVRRLVLTAMRRCPWAKPLYLLALAEGFAELKEEKLAMLRAVLFLGLRTRASLACMEEN